ncbi:MAG: M28 family peptidase [Flavobacteriaceae bacterium]|jgi:hypothetical protein|nr:M28 family peptidase [Flavobacteriaceae bacterium]
MKIKLITTHVLLISGIWVSAQFDSKVFQTINEDVIETSQAYENLKKATEKIGHRLAGTSHGKEAEEMAADILRSYGYEVEFQPFKFRGWKRKSLRLSIGGLKQPKTLVQSVALAHSPEKVSVQAELIYLGNGLESDYLKQGNQVKGKIVFASLGLEEGTPKETQNLHRSEKTALAEKYGAKGIILYNRVPNGVLLTGTASVTGDIISIPAICIGLEDGLKLKEQLSDQKQIASIEMQNEVGEMEARNVIVRQKGSEFPDEKIIVGGHLDSWDLATGAIDNGIGSFSVIDIARVFKTLNLKTKRTVEFILFMGEEVGLLGSKHYVSEALKNNTIDQIKYMSNLDMVNGPKAYSSTMETDKAYLDSLTLHTKSFKPEFKSESSIRGGLHSDHQPFMLQGIPIVGLSGSTFSPGVLNCYHADCDVFDLVDRQGLIDNVRYETFLLYDLANKRNLPSRRLNDNEVREQLIKANLEIPLRISGDWRWD